MKRSCRISTKAEPLKRNGRAMLQTMKSIFAAEDEASSKSYVDTIDEMMAGGGDGETSRI